MQLNNEEKYLNNFFKEFNKDNETINYDNNYTICTPLDENNYEESFEYQDNDKINLPVDLNQKPTNPYTLEKKIEFPKIILNFEKEENKQVKEPVEQKKKCGRKRIRETNEENRNEHNKFSDDNIRRKCKHLVLKYILDFINSKLKSIYAIKKKQGEFLQILNHSQKSNATIAYNKKFLNKSIKEIFSEDISSRFTSFKPNHNKVLILKLMTDSDKKNKIFFNKLFSLTFIQVLKHFTNQEQIDILRGMKCFSEIKNDIEKKYEDGDDYISSLNYYLNNFEKIINNKRERKPKKEKNKII